jgi:hypothetical protein
MTGLHSDTALPNRSDPWEARLDPVPGGGRYEHARQESATSDTAMYDNPFDDPSQEVIPAGHLGKPNDEYRDPYYHAQGQR